MKLYSHIAPQCGVRTHQWGNCYSISRRFSIQIDIIWTVFFNSLRRLLFIWVYSAFITIVPVLTKSAYIFFRYFWKNGQEKHSKCEELYISRFQKTFWKQANQNQGVKIKFIFSKKQNFELFYNFFRYFWKNGQKHSKCQKMNTSRFVKTF